MTVIANVSDITASTTIRRRPLALGFALDYIFSRMAQENDTGRHSAAQTIQDLRLGPPLGDR